MSDAPAKPKVMKAEDVRAAMRRRYCDPEWAVLFEVRNATGHVTQARSADAVAMSLWPSRGLELHGFEIKVSRADWLNERKKPEKAEPIAAYCDRWYLVTANSVVADPSEIPPAWGWIELSDKGELRERRPAEKTEAKPADRKFLAALLRRAHRVDQDEINAILDERKREQDEAYRARVEEAAKRQVAHRNDLALQVEAFEKASGLKISDPYFTRGEEMGRAVKAVMNSGVDNSWNGLKYASRMLRQSAEEIEKAMAELGLEPRQEAKKRGGFV